MGTSLTPLAGVVPAERWNWVWAPWRGDPSCGERGICWRSPPVNASVACCEARQPCTCGYAGRKGAGGGVNPMVVLESGVGGLVFGVGGGKGGGNDGKIGGGGEVCGGPVAPPW